MTIYYDRSSLLSHLCAWLSLVPQAILLVYLTLIYSRREYATISLLSGQLVNELFNFLLKSIIKQSRPTDHLGKGYGMPSSHAQFMCFWAGAVVAWTYRQRYYNKYEQILRIIFAHLLAIAVCYSR